jgi:HEAT repeat protein
VEFLATDQDEELRAARRALVALNSDGASTSIAAALPDAPVRARAVLLDVLSDRGARDQLDVILGATRDADEDVRIAAINAVGALADERAAPKLLALLGEAKSKRERGALESALVATCNRSESPAHRAAPLVAALDINRADDYASLLRVLGRVGGPAAMTAVHNALTDAREPVRDAAFHALTEWPDAGVAEQVLEIAANTEPLKHHVLAMRAYARLVGLGGERSPETMLAMYQAGMKVAQRVEEQKLLLSKLGEVHHARAVAALEPYLTDDRLAAEAASAMINVAEGLLPGGWQPARDALEQVLATSDVDSVRTRAEKVMQRVDEFADFITDWLVAGPYKQKGKKGTEVFDVAFAPELPGEPDVKWKKQPVTKNAARTWFIDLTRSVGGSPGAAYLRTNVFSPEQQEVKLELGSDDGIKVWLNGEVVHSNNVLRGCARKQDVVSVTLNKGFNRLLLKVTDNGGGWAACVRVRSPDGGPVDGVYATAEP